MWKIIKKILRTIALWLPLCCMIENLYAVDGMETIPLHPYITMRWSGETSTSAQVRASDSLNFTTIYDGNSEQYKAIYQYQSALDKNTFYHIRVKQKADSTNSRRWLENITTGIITQQGGEVELLMQPATTLTPYLQTINESTNEVNTISYSYENAMLYKVRSYVGVKAYYYFTNNGNNEYTIDAIMYFNDEFFNYGWNFEASATRYMQCYLGIVFPTVGRSIVESFDVYPVGGSDYNGKLDQIIALLQSQGGGLSREDIEAATLAALEQHDAAEEQKGNNKIQQIKQQIESITEPYKQNLTSLQDATRSITASLNYSGTTAVLKLPEARNPMTNNSLLWEEKEIDLGYYWEQLPQALRSAITIILTFLILYKVIIEMVDEITWVIYMDKNVDKAERNAIGL